MWSTSRSCSAQVPGDLGKESSLAACNVTWRHGCPAKASLSQLVLLFSFCIPSLERWYTTSLFCFHVQGSNLAAVLHIRCLKELACNVSEPRMLRISLAVQPLFLERPAMHQNTTPNKNPSIVLHTQDSQPLRKPHIPEQNHQEREEADPDLPANAGLLSHA